MPEIPETVEFTPLCKQAILTTSGGMERLVFNDLVLNTETAATLAWLLNHDPETALHIEIKLAE